MLGTGCAAVVLVAFGGVSAESIEGSIQARPSAGSRSEPDRKDHYWRVWNGALPERRDDGDHDDVLAILTGKFTGPPKIAMRLHMRSPSMDFRASRLSRQVPEKRVSFPFPREVRGRSATRSTATSTATFTPSVSSSRALPWHRTAGFVSTTCPRVPTRFESFGGRSRSPPSE